MITTPCVLLWPDLTNVEENKNLWLALWVNEIVWLLEMIRKFFDKPKNSRAADSWEIALLYIRTGFLPDLAATFPQILGGIDPSTAALKLLRIYQVDQLDYPIQVFFNLYYSDRDKKFIFTIVYAFRTVCLIILLMHYLAILWIWIGSESFTDYEKGYLPWIAANSDFDGYSRPQLYIFSLYWICTVVTTVGYGDYSGSSSLEYIVTIGLEFFGLVVFSTLQVAVLTLMSYDISYESHCIDQENHLIQWLQEMEQSAIPKTLPSELYRDITNDL